MSFHFTAGTNYIYQEHDDSDLSGLTNLTINGIQFVTTYMSGQITIHVLHPDYHLVLNGTLHHNPDVEVLIISFNGLAPCLSAGPDGHYMYGVETIANGNTRYSSGTGLIITSVDTSANAEWNMKQYGGLSLFGGSFTGRGGVINSSRGIGMYSASGSAGSTESHATFNAISTKFTKTGTNSRREIRFNNKNTIYGSVVNMVVDGFQISQRKVNDVFSVDIIEGEIVQLANSTSNAILTDLDTSNSITETYDLGTDSLGGTNFYEVTNASNGSGTRCMPKGDVGLDRMLGGLITYKNVQFNMSDTDGNGVLDVNLGMIDTDNGYRKNANGYDHTSSNIYRETSDSAGNFDVLKVLTSVTNIDSQGSYSNDDWDTVNYSNRFKVNRFGLDDSTDDRFTFHFWHYLYNYTPITVSMKNLNTLVVPWTLFDDQDITETDIETVLNYTSVDTNARLYDAAKAFVHNNYERDVETGVSRQGEIEDGSHSRTCTMRIYGPNGPNTPLEGGLNITHSSFNSPCIEVDVDSVFTGSLSFVSSGSSIALLHGATLAGGSYQSVFLLTEGVLGAGNDYATEGAIIEFTDVTIERFSNISGRNLALSLVDCDIDSIIDSFHRSGTHPNQVVTKGSFYATLVDGVCNTSNNVEYFSNAPAALAYDIPTTTTVVSGRAYNVNLERTDRALTFPFALDIDVSGGQVECDASAVENIADGVTIEHLTIISGSDTINLSNLSVGTIENATGQPIALVGTATAYIGDFITTTLLTINVFEDSDIYVTDHENPTTILQDYTEITTNENISVGAVNTARVSVNQVGKYATTFIVPIDGNTTFTPVLDPIPFFDPEASIIPTVVTADADSVNIAFTSAVHITQAEMIRTLDNISSNDSGLAYLNLHNQSEKDQTFITGFAGVEFMSNFELHVTGDIEVTTDSFITGSYVFNPENSYNRKVTYSPSKPAVVDYATFREIVDESINADARIGSILEDTGAIGTVMVDSLNADTRITAILEDTNELQGNQSDWSTATGFATINPDNTSIVSILEDTNELQANQGDWITATGFTNVDVDNEALASILANTNELQLNQGDWNTATGFNTVEPNNAAIADILIDTIQLQNKSDSIINTVNSVLVDTDELQTSQGDWVTATGFNTIEPSNDAIDAILADTNELQTNQSDWATATGFNTVAPNNAAIADILVDTIQLQNKSDAILVDTNELQANQGDWITATGFNTVVPDNASISSILEDTAALEALSLEVDYTTIGTVVANSLNADVRITALLEDTNDLQSNQGNWLTATGFSTINANNGSIADILVHTLELQANQDNWNTAVGFSTVNADNTAINAILVDTNELQTNQGDWATATGFATDDVHSVAIASILEGMTELQLNQDNWITATGFNTVEPNNAAIASILADTDDLQSNQGSWVTTATEIDYTAVSSAVRDSINSNSNISSILEDTNELQLNQSDWSTATGFATVDVDNAAVQRIDIRVDQILSDTNELQLSQGDWVTATNFATVNADNESITAILADTSDLQANQSHWTTVTGIGQEVSNSLNTNVRITDILADTNELQANQGNWLTATGTGSTDYSAELAKIINNTKLISALL